MDYKEIEYKYWAKSFTKEDLELFELVKEINKKAYELKKELGG